MKRIILLCISFAIATSIYHSMIYNDASNRHTSANIIIFTPTAHPALQDIERAFKQTMQSSEKSYECKTYNANGNRTLLRAQAEEIVQTPCDLICTIGAACSQTIAELLHKRNNSTPHVFCALEGPAFSSSLRERNASSTGVYIQPDYHTQLELLQHIKPNVKHILLVYDPLHGTGLQKDKDAIEAHLTTKGISLQTVEIYQTNEIQQKVTPLLPTVDVVLVLIDNTVVAGIDALIALCNRFGVTLYASDLASGKKGAALAYGITDAESGIEAARKAQTILEDGNHPSTVSADAINRFRLSVNQATMKTQGLNVPSDKLEQLQGI